MAFGSVENIVQIIISRSGLLRVPYPKVTSKLQVRDDEKVDNQADTSQIVH